MTWKNWSVALLAVCAISGLLRADVPPKPKDDKKPDNKEAKPELNLADRTKASLQWLADHQSAEGCWSAAKFGDDSRRKNAKRTSNLEFVKPGEKGGDGGWAGSVEVGLTGLALLAFLGNGNDHREGEYREVIRRGLMYLRTVQSNDGCFGPKDDDQFVYGHAIACKAMSECFALSGDEALKANVERAVKFILDAQNPGAGWRYGVKYGDSDTSFTGWAVLALKTAKMAGIVFEDKAAFDGASAWLDKMTVETKGVYRTGYNQPGGGQARLREAQSYDDNCTMEAINICARLLMGRKEWDLKNKVLVSQGKLLTSILPKWEKNKIDYIYWYWGTLASYQLGGDTWKTWSGAIKPALVDNQRGWRKEDKDTTAESLDEHGSWDAVDAWAAAGGRVYGTAINCLILQVIAQYERINARKPK